MPLLLILFLMLVPQADNPLATLKEEVKRVLSDARLPFTDDQEREIVLMMEDRRKASEDLFGTLMDFSAGPTQGQDADKLRSAIDWMRNEFLTRLQNYLRPEQLAAWGRHQESETTQIAANNPAQAARPQQAQQTQFVRINNNSFTAELPNYRFTQGGGTPEVIERGGAGAWHGNAQFLFKDDALNAARRSYNLGNRIPTVKPPYSEHQKSFNLSGPLIPGRLTASIAVSHNRAENVDTVSAILGDGTPFGAEIVRPTINKSFSTGGTYQITDRNSLNYNVTYSPYARRSQGIGAFVLPERSFTNDGNNWNLEIKQFSSLSAQSIFETRFGLRGNHDETIPANNNVRINVLDAFNGGGSQNQAETTTRDYEFSNLFTRLGEKLSIKTGMEGVYRKNRSLNTNNFGGTFTFSSPEAFRAGRPANYRVSRGEPLLEKDQLELSFFMQNDLKLTPRLTLMYGLRYDVQTNLSDRNNFGPRLGFAYAIRPGTVIRGGGGLFFNTYIIGLVELQERLNGTRQYEIVIDNPSFPDPFQAGTIRNTPPTVRITDPHFETPHIGVGLISVERTFLTNLLMTLSYDFVHESHRSRLRNINSTYDATAAIPRPCSPGQSAATCLRPDPSKGQVLNLESTAGELRHSFRVSARQRFSIFNASSSYIFQRSWAAGRPNAGGDLPTNNYDLRSDWSLSAVVSAHTFNGNLNAQLPLGVFLSGTMSYLSPKPYNVTTGRDDNLDSQLTDRPPGVPRNSEWGPSFLAFNFNISKAFFFGAATGGSGGRGNTRKNLNVFANMTNAFNHVNYGLPSGVMTSPNFGRSTNGGEPREIEVGLRFQF